MALDRAFHPQRLLDEVRDEAGILAQLLLQVGPLAEYLQRERQHLAVGFLPGGEQEGREPHDVDDLRRGLVGVLGQGQRAQHVAPGLAAAVLDVGGELLLEELQGIVRDRLGFRHVVVLCGQRRQEGLVILGRYAQQVGDDQQGQRLGVLPKELAVARLDELIEGAVGQRPHERLVLLEPPWRHQLAEQGANPGVRRWVESAQEVTERHLTAMLDDLLGDVVASRLKRESRERSDDRIARGEALRVAVDVYGRVVPGDRQDALLRIEPRRALRPLLGVVRIWVDDQRLVGKELL